MTDSAAREGRHQCIGAGDLTVTIHIDRTGRVYFEELNAKLLEAAMCLRPGDAELEARCAAGKMFEDRA
ncbi:MAG: hypothetical protein WD009_11375 [Phycisphaeraceae bacterium]